MTLFSNQVNGHAVPASEHLTSNVDYFTIVTPVDIQNATLMTSNAVDSSYGAPAGSGSTHNNLQTALDKLIEIIAQRGQPVILGAVTANAGATPWTFKFATEHKGSWNVSGNATVDTSAADLQAAIVAAGKDYGFDANTTVTLSANL